MSRETSPYVVGDCWLDKRRDGKSPKIWQIAEYNPNTRSTIYISTKQRDLEAAQSVIHAFVERRRSKQRQSADDAKIIPQLILYQQEHGDEVENPSNVGSAIRLFIGFLMQDAVGVNATIADLYPVVVNRFIAWRMGPHRYSLEWRGKRYEYQSEGVIGATVQRNIAVLVAALNHAAVNGRIPYVPRIPSVPAKFASPPNVNIYSISQMGAMLGVSADNPAMYRWFALLMATAMRPDAALAFDPASSQWKHDSRLLDLHPEGWPRTKKRNPIVPAIEPIIPILEEWKADPHPAAKSRKRAWRTLRSLLGLPADAVPKTIRHSIATELRRRGVSLDRIAVLLGHTAQRRTTAIYAIYDPLELGNLPEVLTTIFNEILEAEKKWSADHLLTTGPYGRKIIVERKDV